MMKTSIKASLIATAIAMLPLGSNAAGLGSIHVFSGIGQPLRAEVELNASSEELQSLSARVAPPEAFRQASLQYTAAISGLRFAVERRGSRSVVKITSDRPFNDPFVDLLIELNWASGRLMREYTFLLDPVPAGSAAPAVGRGAPAAAAPVGAPAVSAQRKAPPASQAPAAAQTAGGERHEIKKGDTLHRIAEANRPEGASLDQMLIALFRENPDAFEGNNINRLRTGSIVTVPSDARVREVDPVQARREVQAQSADFAAYRRKLAGAVAARPATPESAPSRSDAGTIVPKVDEPARPAAGDQVKVSGAPSEQGAAKGADSARLARLQALEEELVARDKALQEANQRVAALEASVKQMQELLNLRSESMAQLQQQASAAPSAPAAAQEPAAAPAPQPPAAEPQQAAPAKEEAPAPVATPKPVPAPTPAPAPVEEPGFVQGLLGDPAVLAGGGGILALLLAYAGIKARQRRKQDTAQGVESIASEFPPPTNSVFGATGGQSVNTGESSVLHTDFSQSGLSAIDTDEGVDPVAEADVYMAYGRDAQAEEILLDALKTDASRMAIYVKLLEIYAQRKNLKAFENTATDLYSRTGGEGGDWDKAAEMGRRLDPENPLYRASAGGGIPTAGLVAGAAAFAGLGAAASQADDSDTGPVASFATPSTPAREPAPTEMPGDAGIEALPEVDAGALDFDLDAGLDFGGAAAAVEAPMPQIDAVPTVEAAPALDEAPSFDLDVGGVAEEISAPEPATPAAPAADPMLATVIGQGMDFAAADQALEFDLAPELDAAAAPEVGEVSLDQTMISPDGAPASGGPGAADDLEKTSFDSSLLDFDFNLDGGANQAAATPPALDLAGIDLNLEATSLASGAGTADTGGVAESAGGLVPDSDVIEEVNTKLELARAYEEMGDTEGARELIEEVLREGSAEQREAAARLAQRLG